MTSVCSISSTSGCDRTGVNDPRPGVGSLEPEPEPPVGPAIEPSAQSEKLVNPSGTFTCEDANGFGVSQAVTGGHGVGRVLAGAVTRTQPARGRHHGRQ